MDKELKTIAHDIQVGTKEQPLWRAWGYSLELDPFAYRPSDSCDFCKTSTGTFYKNICHCGSGGRQVNNSGLGLNSSWSPENGDFTFYSCENCTEKLSELIKKQGKDLLNHEILIEVVEQLQLETNE